MEEAKERAITKKRQHDSLERRKLLEVKRKAELAVEHRESAEQYFHLIRRRLSGAAYDMHRSTAPFVVVDQQQVPQHPAAQLY